MMNTYSRTALLVICIFAGGFPFFYGQSSASEIGSKAQANDLSEQALRVGVKPTSPFVMIDENTGELTGFSIDIIREILIDLEQWDETEFVIHDDLEEHLNAVARGDVDFGIAATSITSNREKRLDFSIPIFQGRLGIASPQENSIHPALEAIFTWEIGGTALLMVSFLLICANLVWATERGQEHSFDDSWRVGVGQALWWTIVTMTTVGYGDFVPRKSLSRFISVLVIIVGIVLFGFAVGTFTSALTIKQFQSGIRSIDDFDGKTVAVITGTVGEQYMSTRPSKLLKFNDLEAALDAVSQGKATGLVHDVAILRYHLGRHNDSLMLADFTFAEHGYAIAFPSKSEYREQLNVVLLEMMEENPSRYARISKWWFE